MSSNIKKCFKCHLEIGFDEPIFNPIPRTSQIANAQDANTIQNHFACIVPFPFEYIGRSLAAASKDQKSEDMLLAYKLNDRIYVLPSYENQKEERDYTSKVRFAVRNIISLEKDGSLEKRQAALKDLQEVVAEKKDNFWVRSMAINFVGCQDPKTETDIVNALLSKEPIDFFSRTHAIGFLNIKQYHNVAALLKDGPILVADRGKAIVKAIENKLPDTVRVLLENGRDDIGDINKAVSELHRSMILDHAVNAESTEFLSMLLNFKMIFPHDSLKHAILKIKRLDMLKFFKDFKMITPEITQDAVIFAAQFNNFALLDFYKELNIAITPQTIETASKLALQKGYFTMHDTIVELSKRNVSGWNSLLSKLHLK